MKKTNRLTFPAAFAMLTLMTLLAVPQAHAADKGLKIGGALRYNYQLKGYDSAQKKRGGDIVFDTFRINVDGHYNKWLISAEYRFYDGWRNLHHGWIGYKANDKTKYEFGLNKVPFGLLPFASHNFWFSGAYYVGLEDQYDVGFKGVTSSGPWNFAAGFYKNSDLGNNTTSGRYSVDVVRGSNTNGYAGYQTNAHNQATNEFAGRVAYTYGKGTDHRTEIGLSAIAGQLYNYDTNDNGTHSAIALHLDGHYGQWNPQLEIGSYQYSPKDPAGVSPDIINMGAYNYAWGVPAKAKFVIANIAYKMPVNSSLIDSVTFYSDNTLIHPDKSSFNNISQNVIGAMIASGPVYTYVDYISGKNMIFDNGNMVSTTNGPREHRINIDVGYYF